jgi:hypothetical protein
MDRQLSMVSELPLMQNTADISVDLPEENPPAAWEMYPIPKEMERSTYSDSLCNCQSSKPKYISAYIPPREVISWRKTL